ncbi:MAG: chromosomal replication initiator protein DnaA [Planctomycetes bacterium]|nr:chromosomal replication initiator protein DnaA [Planctomycetota bacterium]
MSVMSPSVRDQVLASLEQLLGDPAQVEQWFRKLDYHMGNDDRIEVFVPNAFFKDLYEHKYLGYLEEAFRRILGKPVRVQVQVAPNRIGFVAPASAATTAPRSPTAPAASAVVPSTEEYRPASPALSSVPTATGPASSRLDLEPAAATVHPELNPQYTFENFVVAPENRLAHASAMAVAENPGRAYNPLFIHASVGLGKTHLLQAFCHTLLHRSPRMVLRYLSCEEFINEYIASLQRKEIDSFRRTYRSADVLVIDDIHFLANKQQSQEEIFHTFNTLHNAQKQIILSSDQAPQDIPTLEDRLVSRFRWGLVATLAPPGIETRTAILRQKAEDMKSELPPGGISDEVVNFIATHVHRNIRELVGAITNVVMHARYTRQPITLASARESLQHLVDLQAPPVDVHRIQEGVATYFGIKTSDLILKKRGKSNISQARHVAVYLARHMTNMSQAEVGRYFGSRDHTTILNSEQTIAQKISSDPDFRTSIEKLKSRILSQS